MPNVVEHTYAFNDLRMGRPVLISLSDLDCIMLGREGQRDMRLDISQNEQSIESQTCVVLKLTKPQLNHL